MTGKEALLQAFDRLFDRAAKKLRVECSPEEKEVAKRQFEERFAALLEAVAPVNIGDVPDEVMANLEAAIDSMVKSPAWQDTLKKRGWLDMYQPADEFASFLKEDQEKISATLKDIGLVQ